MAGIIPVLGRERKRVMRAGFLWLTAGHGVLSSGDRSPFLREFVDPRHDGGGVGPRDVPALLWRQGG
jgi:hypothetical protein